MPPPEVVLDHTLDVARRLGQERLDAVGGRGDGTRQHGVPVAGQPEQRPGGVAEAARIDDPHAHGAGWERGQHAQGDRLHGSDGEVAVGSRIDEQPALGRERPQERDSGGESRVAEVAQPDEAPGALGRGWSPVRPAGAAPGSGRCRKGLVEGHQVSVEHHESDVEARPGLLRLGGSLGACRREAALGVVLGLVDHPLDSCPQVHQQLADAGEAHRPGDPVGGTQLLGQLGEDGCGVGGAVGRPGARHGLLQHVELALLRGDRLGLGTQLAQLREGRLGLLLASGLLRLDADELLLLVLGETGLVVVERLEERGRALEQLADHLGRRERREVLVDALGEGRERLRLLAVIPLRVALSHVQHVCNPQCAPCLLSAAADRTSRVRRRPAQPGAQAHAPPHGPGAAGASVALTLANTDSRRVVSSWPAGHWTGASASAIERRSSKVSAQVRQRYS